MKKLSNWKDETYYLKSSFMPVASADNLVLIHPSLRGMTLGQLSDGWYLRNDVTKQYCKIPYYLGWTLQGRNRFTFWIGPYAFINEFEDTAEGKYLIDMLKYSELTHTSQSKVDKILDTYKYWVQVDEQMIDILKHRDSYSARVASVASRRK